MVNVAHKIELKPNKEAQKYFAQAAGTKRFAYNWALIRWKELNQPYIQARIHNNREDALELFLAKIGVTYRPKKVKLPKTIKESALRKELNGIKKEQFPWMYEVTKSAPQQGVKDLGKSLSGFFSGRTGYPNLKKKGRCKDSFYLDNTQVEIINRPKIVNEKVKGTISYIRIPKLGEVRMCENVRFSGKLMSVTVSRTADKWFASLSFETGYVPYHDSSTVIPKISTGVDLGIKMLAMLADGKNFYSPRAYASLEKKLKRLQRKLSKKTQGGSNYYKARMKVARLHARIANIRKDCLHKVTTYLTKTYAIIGIEDLNVKAMLKNHCLAKAIADIGFSEFVRQLEYKAEMYGAIIHKVSRWFPSSKLCSSCGYKLHELKLSTRKWECPSCGSFHDRDQNAAKNLENEAITSVQEEMLVRLACFGLVCEESAGSSSVRA